jgi:hypothetical protein
MLSTVIEIEWGSFVFARSAERLLPQLPEVGRLLGTRWQTLYRFDDGWQCLLLLTPYPHQYPTVVDELGELVAATNAPVLAGFLSDSYCLRLVAGSPAGRSWSAHLSHAVMQDGTCGFDHQLFAVLRTPAEDRSVRHLPNMEQVLAWAAEAGLPASERLLGSVLAEDNPGQNRTPACFVEPLGLVLRARVDPLFSDRDLSWRGVNNEVWNASSRSCRRWTALIDAEPDEGSEAMPWDADYIEFIESVAKARYGSGLTREQLAERARELERGRIKLTQPSSELPHLRLKRDEAV